MYPFRRRVCCNYRMPLSFDGQQELKSMEQSPPDCPLCGAAKSALYHRDRRREYLCCPVCRLVFVPPHYFLSPAAEKAEYDLHRNDSADDGYRRFLSRLCTPMLDLLPSGGCGLDFGSGPGPTLSRMFEEAGYGMKLYDPFYADAPRSLEESYDFITATEVVEHLHRPGEELARLWRCLKEGGYLGMMTKLVHNQQAFGGWHYIHDPTHVCFFSQATWHWLAEHWGAAIRYQADDVVIFEKPTRSARRSQRTSWPPA